MELNIKRQSMTINDTVYDSCCEQGIECDVILPDYCPDINQILKCDTSIKILSKQISSGKLNLEGVCYIKIYYVYEDNKVHCHKCKMPFTKSIEMKQEVKNPVIYTSTQLEYLNCRAISQRRLEIRGAATICIAIVDCRQEEVISDASKSNVQLKKKVMQLSPLTGEKTGKFTVKEQIELGYGKNPIGKIVSCHCKAKVSDFKTISGKLVTKGDLCIKLLYYTDTENPFIECMEYSLPISQLLDVEGIDDTYTCQVEYEVLSCDVMPKNTDDMETRIMDIEAEICGRIIYHKNSEVIYAEDCYSTCYNVNYSKKSMHVMDLISILKDSAIHKNVVDLPDNTAQIHNIWCKCKKPKYTYSNGILKIEADIIVCIICETNDGEIKYSEHPDMICYQVKTGCCENDNIVAYINLSEIGVAYSFLGGCKVEYRCEICIEGCIYKVQMLSAVTEIDLKDEKDNGNNNCSLIVYFAEKGECIWDIAKSYNTSIDAVIEENNISGESVEKRTMLLIPIIHKNMS